MSPLEVVADLDDAAQLPARQLLELVLDHARQRVVLGVPRRKGRDRSGSGTRSAGIVGGLLERLLDKIKEAW